MANSPVLILFGPGCGFTSSAPSVNVNTANAMAAAQDLMITLYNYLNITNSEVASLNATFQELLSYYEARAEAIVPYFLNVTWNNTIADLIATYSGLVPSLEGLETAFAQQQFQDWNATVEGWNAAFGAGGTFAATTMGIGEVRYGNTHAAAFTPNGYNLALTNPYQYLVAGAVRRRVECHILQHGTGRDDLRGQHRERLRTVR